MLDRRTLITIGVFAALYAICALQFPAMLSLRVAANLLNDSAYLGVLAIGMTFVIVSGGIDLSVGAVMAFTGVLLATAIARWGLAPPVAFALALIIASSFGAATGAAIHYLQAPPFIATLTAMFFARGASILLSGESIPIRHDLYEWLAGAGLSLPGGGRLSLLAILALAAFTAGALILHRTRFGADVYAIGGDRRAAALLGVRTGRVTILIYALSAAMAALGGVVFSIYTQAGYALAAMGVELEVIAAVVIGGALLTGGVGGMAGAFFGVLMLGLIQTYITFDGTLSSWWAKIATGLLIFAFILIQRVAASQVQAPSEAVRS
jgi:simple sugar transport system permease protein